MSASRTRLVNLGWLFSMGVFAAGAWVSIALGLVPPSLLEMVWAVGFAGGFTTVGIIIIVRRPAEPVGRICLAGGLAMVGAVTLRGVSSLIDRLPGTIPDVGAITALASSALEPRRVAELAAGRRPSPGASSTQQSMLRA